jgi:hypothetical protein
VPEDEAEGGLVRFGFSNADLSILFNRGVRELWDHVFKNEVCCGGLGEKSHDLLGWMDSNEFDRWRLRVWFGAK